MTVTVVGVPANGYRAVSGSGGQVLIDPLAQRATRHRAAVACDLLAAAELDQGRDRPDTVALRQLRLRVGIDLAQPHARLQLGGGGFDALGTLRKAMGVDVLRVASEEGGAGPSLETGKYVTENVYVGVRQGTDTSQTALSVEIDVFENVAVETEVSPNGGNKLGAKYKIDY
jgi:hypothetical protein